MSFKLLAIRPLEGISKELLKGLQENYIYKFYNEYTYEIDTDNSIKSIKFKEVVPSTLYGKNITISAIVGQNGSGKSTLMELIYYSILICNNHFLNEQEKQQLNHKLNLELILLVNDGSIKIIKIENTQAKKTFQYRVLKNTSRIKKYSLEVENDFKANDFDFYSNILNYSIYGLNSNIMPWIDLIFYKNDAYQMPIVINPFKEYGNYDINKEYMLMQSRAIFYTYVLDIKEIIENIYIHMIDFEIDINKIIYLDTYSQAHSTCLGFYQFLEMNIDEEKKFEEYTKIVFKDITEKIISFQTLISFFDVEFLLKNGITQNFCTKFYVKELKDINLYKSFTFLYVFKKLFKISKTYKKYKKYHFLFSERLPFDFFFDDASEAIKYATGGLIESDISLEHIVKQIYFERVTECTDLVNSTDNKELIDYEHLFFIKDEFEAFYRVEPEGEIQKHLQKLDATDSSNLVLDIQNLIRELFNGKEFRFHLFKKFIYEINDDKSHVVFKLNQAINYFSHNIFRSLKISEACFVKSEETHKISVKVDKAYFQSRTKIEDIPLAVFNHNIQVVKTSEKEETKRNELVKNDKLKIYPYTTLSSGEQHLINSTLTIAYHNYNLFSVSDKENNLVKYKNINLIFDELELYLHPEYQRSFINNLINVLNRITEITKQDDVNYNIIMVTHSPFILSDIPMQNILKLKEGITVKDKNSVNSFAANIYDLLKDDFFLKGGAIGTFASKKIKKILTEDKIKKEDIDMINLIGDPFLKGVIKKKIEEKVSDELLEKEIERLRKLQQKRSKNATN